MSRKSSRRKTVEPAEEEPSVEIQDMQEDEKDDDFDISIFAHKKRSFKGPAAGPTPQKGGDSDCDEDDEGRPRKRKRGRPKKCPSPPEASRKKKASSNDDIIALLDEEDDDIEILLEGGSAPAAKAKQQPQPDEELDAYAALEMEVGKLTPVSQPKISPVPQRSSSRAKQGSDTKAKPSSLSDIRQRLLQARNAASSTRQQLVRAEQEEIVIDAPEVALGLPEDDRLVLHIRLEDEEKGIKFKIYKTKPLSQALEAFAQKKEIKLGEYEFWYKDVRLTKADSPAVLECQNKDEIIIKKKAAPKAQAAQAAAAAEANRKRIEVLLNCGHGNDDVTVKIFVDDKFSKLFSEVARIFEVSEADIKFMFDGDKLLPEMTPQSLDMDDGDQIDVIGLS